MSEKNKAGSGNYLKKRLTALGAAVALSGCLSATAQPTHVGPKSTKTPSSLETSPGSSSSTTSTSFRIETTTSSTTSTTIPPPSCNIKPPPGVIPECWINHLPRLPQLGQLLPQKFPDVQQELNFIAQLKAKVKVSSTDYANFRINTTYEHAFANQAGYNQRIKPTAFVDHWSVDTYPQGVIDFIQSMNQKGYRVEFFIDRSGQVYQLFDSDTRLPQHAAGANNFTQGVEIEAQNVYYLTPKQLDNAIMLGVMFDRRNHLNVSNTTIVGHYAIDLLFNNKFYNNGNGAFGPRPFVDKIDLPQEAMDFVDDDSIMLNAQLSPGS